MIEWALDVFFDPRFIGGVVAGSIVLALGIALWSIRGGDEVQRFGGLMVVAATMVVLAESGMLGLSQFLGVTLLAIAGLFHRRVAVATLLAIPGAFLVTRLEATGPQLWLLWFTMIAIVLAAPLVASFDDRYGQTGVPMPLFGIAALGVFLTVPDTEGALVLLGVAGIAGFLGWPKPFSTLGASGSYALAGIYALVAAQGAMGRPASIIASMAALGLLLIVPITMRVHSTGWAHELGRVDPVGPLIVQLVLVLLIARTAGRIAGVAGAAVLAAGLLAAAGAATLMDWPSRRSHLPD